MTRAEPCIAVVDDESPVLTALRRLLRLAEFEVATFSSGEDFLASVAALRPACVILDVHMPGLSGLDVLARLRVIHFDSPVICITASDDLALKQLVAQAGGVSLLRKPFSSDQLLDAVDAALKRSPRLHMR